MAAPQAVTDLVERFERNRESYQSSGYNETQLRREFLDPLFVALGWDVDNRQGHAEAYKDVIHEDAIKVGGATKAPDYCFRVGGRRIFFLEAKKPSVNVAQDVSAAYQLRRYAWSAKLPLSILSDFEELAVYDCRVKPNKTDKPAIARTMFLTFDQYVEKWDELAGIFSREAVLKGSFDKYAEGKKLKRGTAEVDAAFLEEIESWRKHLAQNLALRNKQLEQRELNFAVQRIIDRIIFLRMCEDRGVETYGQLQSLVNGDRVYRRLCELFDRADERYNSGLFHFQVEKGRAEPPDELTPSLAIDDKVLKDMLRGLYYPDSPYEFSVLPAEILGQVYEQFLGKVIRLTAGHQAKIEDKPEVKKAGGVYYTPAYIVDYIVANTVGKLVDGKTPKDVAKLRVLDPACGSGSFLVGALQFLLDWHRDYYVEHGTSKKREIYEGPGGQWFLTAAKKKEILLNNIHGVDIDSQAVEVTKLSLLLKVLENENRETLERQLRLLHERALPDLGNNIKCGNSLIGPDFYDNKQLSLLDEEEQYRINAFDWKAEFPEIFKGKNPGFDAVIGNPPYVLLQDEFRDDSQLSYFKLRYSCATYKLDTYHLFMERAIRLAKRAGWASMITPANFLANNYLSVLRRFLLVETDIDHILIVDGGVFHGISVDNAVWLVRCGTKNTADVRIVHAKPERASLSATHEYNLAKDSVLADKHVLFTGTGGKDASTLWDRCVDGSSLLGELAHVNFGKQLRNRQIYEDDVIAVEGGSSIPRGYRPCYTGRDVERYNLTWGNLACLDDRVAQCGGCWDSDKQDGRNKLITRQIGKVPAFGIDHLGYQCLNTVFMVNVKRADISPIWLLGLLNSRLLARLWIDRFYDQRRTFPKIKGTYLKLLPIRVVDQQSKAHARLDELAREMVRLTSRVSTVKTAHDRTVIQRQIDATDRQIDQLVYELYGLTDEEIRLVEDATG